MGKVAWGTVVIAVAGFLLGLPAVEWALGLKNWVENLGRHGPLLGLLASTGLAVAMVPMAALAMGLGLAYGFVPGVAIAWAAGVIALVAVFVPVRRWLRHRAEVAVRAWPLLAAARAAIGRRAFVTALLLHLSPVYPTSLLHVVFSLTGAPLWRYLAAFVLGVAPTLLIGSYAGSLGRGPFRYAMSHEGLFLVPGAVITVLAAVHVTRLVRRELAPADGDADRR